MRFICRLVLILMFASCVSIGVNAQEDASTAYQIVDEYGGELVDVAISDDATLLIVALPFRIEFYDLTDDDLPMIDRLELPDITQMTVTGNELAVVHRADEPQYRDISIYNTDRRQRRSLFSQMGLSTRINALRYSPDGNQLAVVDEEKLLLFDRLSVTSVTRRFVPRTSDIQLLWSDDSRYLAMNAPDLTIYDTETGISTQTGVAVYGAGGTSLVYDDGRFAIYNDDNPEFAIWDIQTSELRRYEIDIVNRNQLRNVRMSPDFKTVSFTIGREAYVVPIPEASGLISRDDALAGVDAYPDDPVLMAVSAATGHEANQYNTLISASKKEAVIRYRVIPDGDIYSVFKEAIDVVNLNTQQVRTLDRVFTLESGSIFSATDTSVILTGSCGTLTLDFSAQPIDGVFEAGCGEVYDQLCGVMGEAFIVESEFCYYGEGSTLEGDAEITIRRLDDAGEPTGDPLILQGHTDWINGFIFLSDETRLLTWSRDRRVIVWTFLNEEGELELVEQRAFVFDRSISDVEVDLDETQMAVADQLGRVYLYDINADSATDGVLLQRLDTQSNRPGVKFSENYLYTLSGGRVLRWQ